MVCAPLIAQGETLACFIMNAGIAPPYDHCTSWLWDADRVRWRCHDAPAGNTPYATTATADSSFQPPLHDET